VPAPYNQIYNGHDPEEDQLITTLMLAGEALGEQSPDWKALPAPEAPPSYAQPEGNARPAILDDFAELLALTRQIQAWSEADPRRAELLERLGAAFGDGDTLRMLFRNLFPDQVPKPTRDTDGKPLLSMREVQILYEAVGDRSHEEIAERLSISVETVHTHFRHIYKKLGVKRPFQAVTRAISMGYLDIGEAKWLEQAGHVGQSNFSTFNSWLSTTGGKETVAAAQQSRLLAQFGLLLLTASGAAAQATVHLYNSQSLSRGIVCEVNRDGGIVRSFGEDYLRYQPAITLAPPHAARQGFTPGRLFIQHHGAPVQGVNLSEILEFTPEGQFVRAFCGGRDLGTRLGNVANLAFGSDGRLLVASMGLTDAILAFSNGGATVRRFAEGCMRQICVDRSGKVYAIQHAGIGCIVKVFDSYGQLLYILGGTAAGVIYSGIAVNSRGHVFVSRFETDTEKQGVVEVYDANGDSLRDFLVAGFRLRPPAGQSLLLSDALDQLYIPCPYSNDVKVLSPEGKIVRRIDLRGKVVPRSVTVSDEGRLWVSGPVPQDIPA
jgi:DNA-binding CsgD family transcriptional regulator